MNWLFPAFLAGALAIAGPILLHLLRRRPRRIVVFPSLRFIAATQRRSERQHRIQRWIVLALRCAALALIAAAFARPFFGGVTGRATRAVIVVIDNSFSLQARDRWPAARAWALDQIGPLATGDKLGLLLAGPRPTWLAAPGPNVAVARAALARAEPGWGATPVGAALRLAADTLAATPADERRLILLGDQQRAGWAGFDFNRKFPGGVAAIFPAVPARLTRQAALQSPQLVSSDAGVRATVVVRNFTGPDRRQLRIFRGDEIVPVHQMDLALGERETRTVSVDLPATPGTTAYRFTLDGDDLPADDNVYAVGQAATGRTVLLAPAPAGNGADFIAAALASTTALSPAVRVVPTGSWPAQSVAVLRGDAGFTGPAAVALDGFLRSGGAALVFVDGGAAQRDWFAAHGVALRAVSADAGALQAHDWSMDHPVVAALAEQSVTPLLGWEFQRGWALPVNAVEPLARWTEDAAAIGEFKVGAGRVIACGFAADRRDSEWPLHPAFVPFLHRAVAYLLEEQNAAPSRPPRVGEMLELPAAAGVWRAVAGPGIGRSAKTVAGRVVPAAPGVYEFSFGRERRLFAVNLAPEESNPAAWEDGTPWTNLESFETAPPETGTALINLEAMDAEQRAPLWWGILAVVTVLLLAELGLANRTMR